MSRILRAFSGIVSVLFLSLGVFAQSQATTGLIQGTVVDPNGAIVNGASVNVKNTETGFERTVTSNSDGFFSAPLLPLGKYRVTATASGFSNTVLENVEISVGQTLSLRVEMKIGGGVNTVDVSAEGEGIQASQTELATQINERSVENLPINRRDFSRFALLTPGVSIVQGPDGDEITINGQKGIQNNISIDGADANNPFFGEQRGGQRPAFTISLESVKEFQVVPVGASAEFGRASGGFINVVTKSGTNEFSGAAFLFFRNQGLSGQNPDAVRAGLPTEDFRNYQFGGNVGGPIKKDKAFFFVAYERNDGRSEKPNSINPTLATIFRTRFNSTEQGIIQRTNDADVFLGKVDINLNKNNLLTLRHNYSRAEQVNGTFDVPTWGISANGRETDKSNSFIGQLVTNFSSDLLNEFRFQWAKEERPRFYDGPDLPDTTIGTFDGSISYRFGRPFFLPVPSDDVRYQFTDNFTVIRGNHSIKFGIDLNRVKVSQTFIGFARGRYIFAAGTIADAIAGFQDYINGVNANALALYLQFAPIGNRSVEEAGTQAYSNFEPGIYVQDNWQVRSNLTLNLGFRWEGQYQPDPITPPSQTRYGQFLNDPRFPSDGSIPDFTDGYQPRLALSWSPGKDGKTAIRLGAGIFYARIPGLVVAGPRNTDGVIAGNIFFANFLCTGAGLGGCPVYPGIVPTAGFSPFNPGIAVFARDFKNPRTIQYSASIERELAKDFSLLVAYNLAKSTRLTRFVNRGDGRLYPGGVSPFERANGSGVGEIRSTESSARSLYQGLTITLNKRFSHRYQFQINYLASYDKSDDDNERDPFTFRYVDPRNLTPEYNWSDRDQRTRINAFATFLLPYGINLSPILQYRSAQPVSLVNRGAFPSIVERNTERLKNEFFTLDVRVSKVFNFNERVSLEPIFEAFNIFNNRNQRSLPRPLTFNFDGTVSAGFGEPRQAQLGVRFKF
ncbi:MAG TPA: carboxypeptidase regulatory-like domain-containing protein [Pyrinomonadaceae bacterium]|nr:carboxypeptidase regulatory-like domain-containing protein [Pyrinomonadaceae bacterium]